MLRGEVNSYPIQLLVNYWEIPQAGLNARLNELLRHGISHLATFVPWQAVESDISHTLSRFLQAVAERKMTVSLILTPEVGVHYPNSGLPKDLIAKPDLLARHAQGNQIYANLPPNSFPLPSLSSADFGKRYHNFLTRIDTLLADLAKTEPQILNGVTMVLTGSFWKYYRAPQSSAQDPFGDLAGDFSGPASVGYRQRIEQFYQQREFAESTSEGAPAHRWKTRPMEEVNRRWFYQHCEDVFRTRSTQALRRRATSVSLEQMELFTPEADPGFMYSSFLQMVSGFHGDFYRLAKLVDDAATRASSVTESDSPSFIHWTGLGGFRSLSDSEKQFLILKSLLMMGGRRGGILIDESEWFTLSRSFRARAENIARLINSGDLRFESRALYLAPHLWSSAGEMWDELRTRVGGSQIISSADRLKFEKDAKLLIIDTKFIFTQDSVRKIMAWARTGKTVAIPRTTLFTDAARFELEEAMAEGVRPIEMDLGFSYRLQNLGQGRLIVFENQDSQTAMQTFMSSLISLSEVSMGLRASDSKLTLIPMRKKRGGVGLFILNGTSRAVAADLLFQNEVRVADLWSSISAKRSDQTQSQAVPSSRFALEVPPSGILPISVDGLPDDRSTPLPQENAALPLTLIEKAGSPTSDDVGVTWN